MWLVCIYQLHRLRKGNCGVAVLRYFEYGSSMLLRNIAILSTKLHIGWYSVNVLDFYSDSSVQTSGWTKANSFSSFVPSGQCRDITSTKKWLMRETLPMCSFTSHLTMNTTYTWYTNGVVNHWNTRTQLHDFEGRNFIMSNARVLAGHIRAWKRVACSGYDDSETNRKWEWNERRWENSSSIHSYFTVTKKKLYHFNGITLR